MLRSLYAKYCIAPKLRLIEDQLNQDLLPRFERDGVVKLEGASVHRAGKAAHPNSRFTVSARQNPSYTPVADAPQGVPLSAIVFGGRRREVAPLVYEARDWKHGVLVGAGVSDTVKVGVMLKVEVGLW